MKNLKAYHIFGEEVDHVFVLNKENLEDNNQIIITSTNSSFKKF